MERKIFDFFISHTRADEPLAQHLRQKITERGFSCFDDSKDITPGENGISEIVEAIRSAKYVIILISEQSLHSELLQYEIESTVRFSAVYDKPFIAFVEEAIPLSELFRFGFSIKNIMHFPFSLSEHSDLDQALDEVLDDYENSLSCDLYYEQLQGYIKIKDALQIVTVTKKIINKIMSGRGMLPETSIINLSFEITPLLRQIRSALDYATYDQNGRDTAHVVIEITNELLPLHSKLRDYLQNMEPQLYEVAAFLTLFSFLYDIEAEAIDILSNGDCRFKVSDQELEQINVLCDLYDAKKGTGDRPQHALLAQLIDEVPSLPYYRPVGKIIPVKRHTEREEESENEKYPQLQKIAEYINESNKLFEALDDEDLSFEFMSCLKTSYERLKNYSLIVGCKSIASICIEKIAYINQKLERLEAMKAEDGKIAESSFRALLGFQAKAMGNYDVFISYNHEDADLADNVYKHVKSNLIDAFYDKVTLPQLGNSEYREAIMDALDRSTNFIVVLSKLEYMQSEWVKLEMKTFKQEIDEGRKSGSNFIFVVTPDVFKEIIASNKKILPIQYRSCEIIQTTDYRDILCSYLRKSQG